MLIKSTTEVLIHFDKFKAIEIDGVRVSDALRMHASRYGFEFDNFSVCNLVLQVLFLVPEEGSTSSSSSQHFQVLFTRLVPDKNPYLVNLVPEKCFLAPRKK